MSATATMTMGTSNMRGTLRQRTNPTRTTKTTLRQNSLVEVETQPVLIENPRPANIYPAVQHLADAITALPREYRRHTSLLKEVDAKAWQLEANLQTVLGQCAIPAAAPSAPLMLTSAAGSTANLVEEANTFSAANSVVSAPADHASLHSTQSTAPSIAPQRQNFHTLRQNLIHIMQTLDEKNHVINNANQELSRHIRRLDTIWPHVSNEISEEAMYGSLTHWAFAEMNPNKKNAPTTRREAAANLALLHDSEAAQRSENRREAVAAKSRRNLARIDAGFAEINNNNKKVAASEKRRAADVEEMTGLGIIGAGKGKKPRLGAAASMEKSMSTVLGARAMSREPSQAEGGRKRKAPAAPTAIARKRSVLIPLNVSLTNPSRLNAAQDSPKLASPLASTFGKEAYKRSPALTNARPAGRGRQNSTQQSNESSRARQASSSIRNGVTASTPELQSLAVVTGKTANEIKHTMRETTTSRGDRMLEDDTPKGGNNDAGIRGGLLLERTDSRSGSTRDRKDSAKAADSPRLGTSGLSGGRGRVQSKTSTPTVGTFAESDSFESVIGMTGKSRRLARQRIKDHGLHDSLSPKGLPLKRSHKKGAGIAAQQSSQKLRHEMAENVGPLESGGEEEGDGEEMGEDEEEKYCYCLGPSYGEMIACDDPKCSRQWFHLRCLQLKNAPKSEKWYCEECREERLKRNGNGRR